MALVTLCERYRTPLAQPDQIRISELPDAQYLREFTSRVAERVQETQRALGLENVPTLKYTPDQGSAVKSRLAADDDWKREVTDLLSRQAISRTDWQQVAAGIYIPWFNKPLLFRRDAAVPDKYNSETNTLEIDALVNHSYITQLGRRNIIPQTNNDSASIAGVVVTIDNKIPLGLRAGAAYSNTFMVTPAGSVEVVGHLLFDTTFIEADEELGLKPEDIITLEFLGRIFEHKISNNSLYVPRIRTNLTAVQVEERWRTSTDQLEHSELVFVDDDPESVTQFLREHRYDATKLWQENARKVLAHGALPILVHCINKHGLERTIKAAEELMDEYQLF
ncbi:hypothetical protein HYV86_04480 [Candidatus Woesearchaeota archaeon]|nr:hypothetical protein [Candidatus Woesearchaeota archaeon]